jgi:hypothetical protein
MSPMTGKPLLQAPHIHPARSSVTGPRLQRGHASMLVNEFISVTEPAEVNGMPRAAMLAGQAAEVNPRDCL